MDNSKQSKQILLSVIGVAILVVAVVGVSFAFFNYTTTGAQNTVSTGKIKFTSTQSGDGVSLTNKFPITTATYNSQSSGTYNSATMDFARIVVTINGETTYAQGLDFRVTAKDVNFNANGNNAVSLPVNVVVTATQTGTPETDDRITGYSSTNGAVITEGQVLADGHIAGTATYNDGTRFDATVTIDAYLDGSKIAITDTYAGSGNAATDENGTSDANWVNGRVVFTTDQWNTLSNSAANNLSFKVSVESRETGGTYVS